MQNRGHPIAVLVVCVAALWWSLVGCERKSDKERIAESWPSVAEVSLAGPVHTIVQNIGETVALPSGFAWQVEHVEKDPDPDFPLITLDHGLTPNPYGVPGDGRLPDSLVAVVEDHFEMSIARFDRYDVQLRRVVLLKLHDGPKLSGDCFVIASVIDMRFVTGAGSEAMRWEIHDGTPLAACPFTAP